MKKTTNWTRYYQEQMTDPATRSLVEDEIKALRIGVQLAKLRQDRGLSQSQLAAKVGMRAPNISRIETDPTQNLTLHTMVKLFQALDCEIAITPKKRPATVREPRRRKYRRDAPSRG
jgi:transcriptional regulator with XRE-family HTH domain